MLSKKESALLEGAIKKLLRNSVSKKYHPIVDYQIQTGGKRIRPALTLLCTKLLGGKIKNVLYPAAALEILHNYTLIIDDIIDHSTVRRNQPTLWSMYGKSVAECISINYASSTFEGISQTKNPEKIQAIFSKVLKTIVEGEIEDILMENSPRTSERYIRKNLYTLKVATDNDYLKMITKKTACLFEACCEVAALCSGASIQETAALKRYGLKIGLMFQITDDMLDILGDQNFGKQVGKDIVEGKRGNILIMYAYRSLPQKQRSELTKIMKLKRINIKQIQKAVSIIKSTNCISEANKLRQKLFTSATRELRIFPNNIWKKSLLDLTEVMLIRKM